MPEIQLAIPGNLDAIYREEDGLVLLKGSHFNTSSRVFFSMIDRIGHESKHVETLVEFINHTTLAVNLTEQIGDQVYNLKQYQTLSVSVTNNDRYQLSFPINLTYL